MTSPTRNEWYPAPGLGAKRVAYIAKEREMQSDYMSYKYVTIDKLWREQPILEPG